MALDLGIGELESGRAYNYGGRLHWKYVERASLATKGRHSRLAHQRDEDESCLVHIKISDACPWYLHSDQVAFSCHGLAALTVSSKAQAHLPNGSVVDRPQDIIFEAADHISVQCHNLCWMLECIACAY